MELAAVVEDLARSVPEAIGAILCDYEGEAVVLQPGAVRLSDPQVAAAREHLPRALESTISLEEFWLRLGGAVPGPALHQLREAHRSVGRGTLVMVELSFAEAAVLVGCLPEDYYVLLALRRPALRERARVQLSRTSSALAALLR